MSAAQDAAHKVAVVAAECTKQSSKQGARLTLLAAARSVCRRWRQIARRGSRWGVRSLLGGDYTGDWWRYPPVWIGRQL
jgi:hypothetical protein